MNSIQIQINEIGNKIEFHKDMISQLKVDQYELIKQLKRIKSNRGACKLGYELEGKRIDLGYSIKDLCILADITSPAYRAIITGKCKPRKKTIGRINKALLIGCDKGKDIDNLIARLKKLKKLRGES